jgi:hypothetical protein
MRIFPVRLSFLLGLIAASLVLPHHWTSSIRPQCTPEDLLVVQPASPLVNNVRNGGPELIATL